MKRLVVVLFAALIMFVGTAFGKFQKALQFQKLVEFSTRLVKDLEVSGIESYIPSKKEAQKNLEELGRIQYISQIKDPKLRNSKWAENPKLKILKFRLQLLAQIAEISPKQQEKLIEKHEKLLETTVKLSMLDTKNKKSPLYGKDFNKSMKAGLKEFMAPKKPSPQQLKKAAAARKQKQSRKNAFKPKFNRKDDVMKLMYSKVIPPQAKMPDINKLVFKDEIGRTCYCSC